MSEIEFIRGAMRWPKWLRCKETANYGMRQERCSKLRGHGRRFGNLWHRFVVIHKENQ